MEGMLEYNRLPAINTFPQFNRPISILSPLDLSLRTSLIPITPPSTPSPPRKRLRNTEENINLWRPHSFGYFDSSPFLSWNNGEIKKISEKLDETNKSDNNHTHIHNKIINDYETIVLTEDEGENDDSAEDDDDNDDEEFVDILSNDDDIPAVINSTKISIEEHNYIGVLSKEKLVYEDPTLHNQAIEGFAKLFDKNFINDNGKIEQTKKNIVENNLVTETNSQQIFRQLMKSKYEKRKFKIRKQLIDEDNSSPVSGTIIRKLRDDEELVVTKGDIDPAFNVVEITDEAKAILASIDNKIGSYICQLCRTMYDDAFQLAQHRCTRIVHIEYRCTECDKVFNCPANLASHRRWHKPKSEVLASQNKKSNTSEKLTKVMPSGINSYQDDDTNLDGAFNCQECGKGFRRQAYLKKHLTSHQILNDFKSMETFKNPTGNYSNSMSYSPSTHNTNLYQPSCTPNIIGPNTHHSNHRLYSGSIRFPQFFPNFDQRSIHPFGEFYFPQNWDRNSAFQYVHNQHLRSGINSNGVVQQISPLVVK